MQFLENNPTVKRVVMIVAVLAVVAIVAYVIYYFTAGDGSHSTDTTTSASTIPGGITIPGGGVIVPTDKPGEITIPGGITLPHGGMTIPASGFVVPTESFDTMSPTMQREGFEGCPARQQVHEGFEDPMAAESNQESGPKTVGADNTLGMNQMPSECYPKDVLSSVDLLPSDANSHYAMVNPNGQGALSDQNFLTAGYHIGINTVGQTLRNANRQLRSDPPCPQVPVSPWLNTTIEYDGNRRPLEIGGAP